MGVVARTLVIFAAALGLAAVIAAVPADAAHHRYRHGRGHGSGMSGSRTDPSKDAALIVDGASGKVLYSRNADAERHPASLTKMMTLYLLFDAMKKGQVNLSTPLPVSYHAAVQRPTKLNLRVGDTIPVDVAIRAIVVRSANDVAVTIAEALGGTESHFAELMTAKARQIGMRDTFYHNASGLPDALQISTASDLAILARHLAYDFPQYFHYFAIPGFTYRGVTYLTHDNLIGRYQGADGIKTGYTGASGFNLVSSVTRGSTHIIGVVMGGTTAHRRDMEMMDLLDATFVRVAQNPTLVASAKVPWQSVAQNTASFDLSLPSAGPSFVSPTQVASADAEDEDAAEARADADQQVAAITPAPPAAAPVRMQALPPSPSPPPQAPKQVATAASAPAAAPVRMQALPPSPPPQPAAKQVAVNAPVPTPRPPMAAPAQQLAHAPTPKPRPVLVAANTPPPAPKAKPQPEVGEGDYGVEPPAATAAPKLSPQAWTIQIGAYADSKLARAQLASYAERSMDVLGQAARIIVPFRSVDGQTLFRARFGPFAEREARAVCAALTQRGQTCFAALGTR
jgi:D-alanyl-D-alanine carboxypeptidase